MKKLSLILISTIGSLLLAECCARWVGLQPYHLPDFHFTSEPNGCFGKDSLGLTLIPGKFVVDVNNGLVHKVTHGRDSFRITSFTENSDSLKPSIFMYGCSYTYGQGVDDEKTYPFLVQNKLPSYIVHNYAVPGYGTQQPFLLLKKALASGERPEIVVLNYADFHEERNVLSRSFEYKLYQGFQQVGSILNRDLDSTCMIYPRTQLITDSLRFQFVNVLEDFKPFPLREYSSLMNQVDRLISFGNDREELPPKYSKNLIKAIQSLCTEYHITFIVAEVGDMACDKEMADFCEIETIFYVNIAPDFSAGTFRNLPYDYHPNESAHQHYAESLTEFLYGIMSRTK